MNYYCNDCGCVFESGLQGDILCPECGGSDIEEAVRCGNDSCIGMMRIRDYICADCRRDLLARVIDFFDTLTAEEEEQFDEWMDGNSITDRRKWEV